MRQLAFRPSFPCMFMLRVVLHCVHLFCRKGSVRSGRCPLLLFRACNADPVARQEIDCHPHRDEISLSCCSALPPYRNESSWPPSLARGMVSLIAGKNMGEKRDTEETVEEKKRRKAEIKQSRRVSLPPPKPDLSFDVRKVRRYAGGETHKHSAVDVELSTPIVSARGRRAGQQTIIVGQCFADHRTHSSADPPAPPVALDFGVESSELAGE